MPNVDNKYQIGQTIFILSGKAQKIIPAIVVEETTIKSLSGEHISWKISVGPEGDKRKTVEIDKVDGEIYSSLEAVKETMLRKLHSYVESLILDANKKLEDWYNVKKINVIPKKLENKEEKLDISSFEELKHVETFMSKDTEEQLEDPDNLSNEVITLPDGQKVKVNIKGQL